DVSGGAPGEAAREREAEARTVATVGGRSSDARLEDALALVLGDPGAVVLDDVEHPRAVPAERDGDARPSVAAAVLDQRLQDARGELGPESQPKRLRR